MSITIVLDPQLYPRECLGQASTAFSGRCLVSHSQNDTGDLVIEIEGGKHGEDHVVHEFLNYLLDLSIERHLSTHGTN